MRRLLKSLLRVKKKIRVIYAAVNGFCDRMLYRLFALILKPIIRILISYLYFIILRKLFNWSEGESLYTIHSICLAVTHGLPLPPEEDSFGINVLMESFSNSSQNSLELFRAQNVNTEAQLFSSIRAVESQLAHGLPPQLNPGEYEGLVREHLEGAVTIRTYQRSLALELFDVQIMEKKVFLQNKLFDLFLADPRLNEILAISPFQERDIRPAIFDFIEGKVEPVSAARDSFQRNLLEASLLNFIRELERSGRQSFIYREFYAYFSDEEFRQRLRDP